MRDHAPLERKVIVTIPMFLEARRVLDGLTLARVQDDPVRAEAAAMVLIEHGAAEDKERGKAALRIVRKFEIDAEVAEAVRILAAISAKAATYDDRRRQALDDLTAHLACLAPRVPEAVPVFEPRHSRADLSGMSAKQMFGEG